MPFVIAPKTRQHREDVRLRFHSLKLYSSVYPYVNTYLGVDSTYPLRYTLLMTQTHTVYGAVDNLIFAAYRHNREISPDVEPGRWSAVFRDYDVASLEARYQREQTCPLCLRKGEQLTDGSCWRCTALATDVDE